MPAHAPRPDAPGVAVQAVRSLARLARLLERASDECTLAHYRILAAIDEGDERASRIATRLALGKPAVSANLDALCRRGLLERVDVAADQRAAALHLTEEGRVVLQRVESAMVAQLDELAALTPDPPALVACLGWLSGAIDEAREQRRETVKR